MSIASLSTDGPFSPTLKVLPLDGGSDDEVIFGTGAGIPVGAAAGGPIEELDREGGEEGEGP